MAVKECEQCGDKKKIKGYGLCQACYSKHRRQVDPYTEPGRQRRYLAEKDRAHANLVRILALVHKVPWFSPEQVETIEGVVNGLIAVHVMDGQEHPAAKPGVHVQ
jgi:hypothetical protein